MSRPAFAAAIALSCMSLLCLAQDPAGVPPAAAKPAAPKIVAVRGGEQSHNPASAAVDGNWQTVWSTGIDRSPEAAKALRGLDLDLGEAKPVYGFVYLPTPYTDHGRIADYALYVSQDGKQWGEPVAKGTFAKQAADYWPNVRETFETVLLPKPITGRFVRFDAISEANGDACAAIAELVIITDPANYPFKKTTLALLKGTRMAPSIHIAYSIPAVQAFYVEAKVEKSTDGSYFMTAGWDGGYFGIQDQGGGRKVVIFSVWDDHAGDNPGTVPGDKQVKVTFRGDGVRVGRFGGEGTGNQSFFNFDWKVGETYRFAVTAEGNDKSTSYTGYLQIKEPGKATGTWKKLVTFAVPRPIGALAGTHSFVEDFRRDFDSFKETRSVQFTNAWGWTNGEWVAAKQGRFTVDGNPNRNIDAETVPGGFRLSTGGDIKNVHARVRRSIIMDKPNTTPPTDLPEGIREFIKNGGHSQPLSEIKPIVSETSKPESTVVPK